MKKLLLALLLWPSLAFAQIIPTLPVTLTNGTLADANQVMSNFNTIVTGVNTNAAKNGANSDITSLSGLSTPITPAQGGSSVYSGTDTGSANAYSIAATTPTGFSLIAGRSVVMIPSFTNTAAATLAIGGTAVTPILRQTSTGLVPLVGGEIVIGQQALMFYDGTQYELVNSAVTSNVAPCTSIDYAGVVVPLGYLAEDGSAVSRTTFANLFGCLAYNAVAATLNGTTTVTVPNSALFQVGWSVGGPNVTCNSTISSIPGGGVTIVINNAAGASGASTLTIGPYPQGDCSTTFNLPNFQGRATAMADASGGTVLTATTCTRPNSIGTSCGTQTKTLGTGNLPPYTPSVSALTAGIGGTGNANGIATGTGTSAIQSGAGTNIYTPGSFSLITIAATFNAQGGTSTPVSSVAPIALVTKAIKF